MKIVITIEDIKFIIRIIFYFSLIFSYICGWVKWAKINTQVKDNEDKFEKACEGFYGLWIIFHILISIAAVVVIVIWSFT